MSENIVLSHIMNVVVISIIVEQLDLWVQDGLQLGLKGSGFVQGSTCKGCRVGAIHTGATDAGSQFGLEELLVFAQIVVEVSLKSSMTW